jgi:hypothetical protein
MKSKKKLPLQSTNSLRDFPLFWILDDPVRKY